MSMAATGNPDSQVFRLPKEFLCFPVGCAPSLPWRLETGFASETGHRKTNEDCGYANVREGVFLVADGVGGSHGGAVASHTIVDTVPAILLPIIQSREFASDELHVAIRESLVAAHKAMAACGERDPNLSQMSSTCVLGVVGPQSLLLTHVGDSRAYLLRAGAISQLTKDHSVVQALMDAGCLTKEQAKSHIYRHVITESVNGKSVPPVEIAEHPLRPGDRFLFATDGLTDVVDENSLGEIIATSSNPQETADVLVQRALECGSHDNITCLVLHVEINS